MPWGGGRGRHFKRKLDNLNNVLPFRDHPAYNSQIILQSLLQDRAWSLGRPLQSKVTSSLFCFVLRGGGADTKSNSVNLINNCCGGLGSNRGSSICWRRKCAIYCIQETVKPTHTNCSSGLFFPLICFFSQLRLYHLVFDSFISIGLTKSQQMCQGVF